MNMSMSGMPVCGISKKRKAVEIIDLNTLFCVWPIYTPAHSSYEISSFFPVEDFQIRFDTFLGRIFAFSSG